jgi:hypothetical protein
VSYKEEHKFFHGKILDISSAGIAAKFDKTTDRPLSAPPLQNVQLKLHGGIVMVDMHLIGQRSDDRYVQILLFDSRMSTDHKLVIHRYIKQCLQKYINGLKL